MSEHEEERLARVALNQLGEPGDTKMTGLVAELGARRLHDLLLAECDLQGLRTDVAARLAAVDAARDLERAERLGLRFVVPGDAEWPTQLEDLAGAGVAARAGRRPGRAVGPRTAAPRRARQLGRRRGLAGRDDLRRRPWRASSPARSPTPGTWWSRAAPSASTGRPTAGPSAPDAPDAGGGGLRRRPGLPRGPPRDVRPHRPHRRRGVRGATGRCALPDPLPGPQPPHRGADARHRGRRGGQAQRCAQHRQLGPPAQPHGDGRARAGDQPAVGRGARAAAHRCDAAGHPGRRRARAARPVRHGAGRAGPRPGDRARPAAVPPAAGARRGAGSVGAPGPSRSPGPPGSGCARWPVPCSSCRRPGSSTTRTAAGGSPSWLGREPLAGLLRSTGERGRRPGAARADDAGARRLRAAPRRRARPHRRTRCAPTSATSPASSSTPARMGQDDPAAARPADPAQLAGPAAEPRSLPHDRRAAGHRGPGVHRLARAHRSGGDRRGRQPRLAQGPPHPAVGAACRRGLRPDRGRGRRGRRRQPGRHARRRDARAALRDRHPGRRARRARRRRRRPRPQRRPRARQGPQGAHGAVRSTGRAGARLLAAQRTARDARRRVRAPRSSSGPADAGSTSAPCARSCTAGSPRCPGPPTSGRTACGTAPRPTCWRAEPTSGRCRSCSATRRWPRRSATPTSRPTGCAGPTPRPTPAPERGQSPNSRRNSAAAVGATGAGGARRLVAPQRQQPDRSGVDQTQGVEVGRRALDPAPVQAGPREAVRARQLQHPDRLALRHRAADRHGAGDRLVGRAGVPWATTTTPRPARRPAYDTVPGSAAWTTWPTEPARSTPRCPAPYGDAGGSKPSITAGSGCSGHEPTGSVSAVAAGAVSETTAATSRRARVRRVVTSPGSGRRGTAGPGQDRACGGGAGTTRACARLRVVPTGGPPSGLTALARAPVVWEHHSSEWNSHALTPRPRPWASTLGPAREALRAGRVARGRQGQGHPPAASN